jgi:hypothetical protein
MECLRRVVSYVVSSGLAAPSDFVARADVDSNQFNNFHRSKGGLKRPSEVFQRRVLNFVFELRDHQKADFGRCTEDVKHLHDNYYHRLRPFDDMDILYRLLTRNKVVTQIDCDAIYRNLYPNRTIKFRNTVIEAENSGNFYTYRYSPVNNIVYRSHLSVNKPYPYSKVPSFVHIFKNFENQITKSVGNIIDLEGRFIFFGFSVRDEIEDIGATRPTGVALMVVTHGVNISNSMSGFFVSNNGRGDYSVGTLRIIRTNDRYDRSKIGILPEREFDKNYINKDMISMEHHDLIASTEAVTWQLLDHMRDHRQLDILRNFMKTGRTYRSTRYYRNKNQK